MSAVRTPADGAAGTPAAPTPARDGVLEDVRLAFSEVLSAERRLRARKDHARRGPLSFSQTRALFMLCEPEGRGGVTAGQLARMAELTPASVTAMLDQAEREGMVERVRSSEDRRVVLVQLTEAGEAYLAERRALWRAHWQEALGDVTDADLAATARVMRRIGAVLDDF